ncbi:MAG TPA: tetratricopeptide repeat protein [Steroidobacteraceae bacterium]|jgi:eukaryotic-like serine/threonine-protein kinase|nr:tetratricopeptide repeat protein [Steroidobacteraceae bacterium]
MTQHKNDEDLFVAALDSFDDAVDFVPERCVEQIGAYRLLRELGEGGCGIAYLAEQLAPVKRQVALKIIKPGMDTKAVVARFEAERQLLALMDHPNVAKVFDAGSTPAGRPYFVMELVRGLRITEYCEQLRLSIAERLQLFMQVCQAIQHAHHKGVMHRDIKPSNVLVTMHDGLPVAKVIDFGIAKATQGPLSERTLHTAIDQFIGTPAYVSPEQTDLTQRNVDTRSDIYSLGVLLYELLTGYTPLDTAELLHSTPDEMRRRVREVEPLTPSTRLKSLALSTKDVQGDLDWIVMRCLEKEPARRYQTVNDLLLDIQRHLRHEPIVARPPSVAYTLQKFARRNRTMFAALLAAAIFIFAFAVNTSVQVRRVAGERARVEQERQRGEKVAEFMLETLAKTEPFGYAETGHPETAKELLDRAARWLRQDTSQNPELRARLLETLGRAYRRRGDDKSAVSYLQDAVRIRKGLSGGQGDMATAAALVELSMTVREGGAVLASDQVLLEAGDIAQRLEQQHSLTYARILTNRGRVQMKLGKPDVALIFYDETLALLQDLLGPRDTEVADLLVDKSSAFLWQDDFLAAERNARAALEIYATALPKLHPDLIYAQTALGDALRLQDRLDEASVVLKEALLAYRTIYGENGRQVADVLDALGKIQLQRHDLSQAEQYAQLALATAIRAEGLHHWRTAVYRTSLAVIQIDRKEYAEAEAQLRSAIANLQQSVPADHPYRASAEHFLGEVLLRSKRLKEAEAVFTTAMNRSRRANEPTWRAARSASGLGEALYRQGRASEGEQYLVNSSRTLSADRNADASAKATARERVVRFYTERGQSDELQALTNGTLRADAQP